VWTGGTTSVTGVIANSALGTSAADTTNLLFPLAADGMVAYKATGLSFRTASAFTTSSGSAGVIRVKVAYRTWPTELA
jgi:hypothetical protein